MVIPFLSTHITSFPVSHSYGLVQNWQKVINQLWQFAMLCKKMTPNGRAANHPLHVDNTILELVPAELGGSIKQTYNIGNVKKQFFEITHSDGMQSLII